MKPYENLKEYSNEADNVYLINQEENTITSLFEYLNKQETKTNESFVLK